MKIQFLDSEVALAGMNLPVRSVWIEVSDGDESRKKSLLISPGSRLTEEQFRALPAVTDVVAPNYFHTAGMEKARRIFPKALVWGTKDGKSLSAETWPYQAELPLVKIQGMPKVNECVFIHKASKTLIVTDLCFNLLSPKGWSAFLFLSLFGTYKRFAVSRLFLNGVKDKKAFEASLAELMTHEFDKIILSHGEPIEANGKARLLKALQERGYLLSN